MPLVQPIVAPDTIADLFSLGVPLGTQIRFLPLSISVVSAYLTSILSFVFSLSRLAALNID